ncbi:hypothetical protein [Sphingomonas kyeonggiensis]|uniref:CRISPR/Cas system-associated endoribonuclease Cas2 n=1 Tax=Sphingomonas kyeonggiensis TaxID=1268553 RepID=A0A7W6NVW4_9SPHN|nr:hypothetical protein [Sphingomonas kyeonggiensis]MBB4096969.1 CRISPR/Cas system-associated endoribonuclease Cas2 [Sphingomonas kyeonggiensis]
MAAFIVTYDLMKQGQNYTCITNKLKSYGTHWHLQGSVWIIETTQSAVQIRDSLKPCLDQNDKLLVARLEGEAAWLGYGDEEGKWLKDRLQKRAY